MNVQLYLTLKELELVKSSLEVTLEELNKEISETNPAPSIMNIISPQLESYKKVISYLNTKIDESKKGA